MPVDAALETSPPPLDDFFAAAAACIARAWPQGHPAADALTRLRDRLRGAALQLAVVGQFKRGKSTFLNAILGGAYLPMAVVPATAIPTFIAWAETISIRTEYLDGRTPEVIDGADVVAARMMLRDTVTEEGNKLNWRGIARVDLRLPAAWLHDGIVLIDTPGIGSTLQHNTDAAIGVLPECDAAIFLLAADPPITEAEARFLQTLRGHVMHLFVALNKIDQVEMEDRPVLLDFVTTALAAAGEIVPRIFPLSARQALEARCRGDAGLLTASGLLAIRDEVLLPLQRRKQATLHGVIRGKAAKLLDQIYSDTELRIRAFELPLEEIEARRDALDHALADVERERCIAQDLLEADRRRAAAGIEDMATALRQRAYIALLEAASGTLDEAAMTLVLTDTVPSLFDAEMAQQVAALRQGLQAVLDTHVARADALVDRIRHEAETLCDIAPRAGEISEAYVIDVEPYWVSRPWQNGLFPSPASLMERLLPMPGRRARLHARLESQIDALVVRNVENLRWSMLRGLDATFRRFSTQCDERLAEVRTLTLGAIDEAIRQRQTKGEQASNIFAALRDAVRDLTALRHAIFDYPGQSSCAR